MSLEQVTGADDADYGIFSDAAEWLQVPPQIVEKIPFAIYACDAAGRILWFNRRAVRLWGRTPSNTEEYCGSYKLLLDGHLIPKGQSPMAQVLKTGCATKETEVVFERPDGSAICAAVRIEFVKDARGHVVGAINCFHDVTDRTRAEQSARQQDRRLAETYARAGIGIAEVSAEGKLLRVNAHLARLLGRTAEELLGWSIFDARLAESHELDEGQFRRQVSGEIVCYTVEKNFVRPDGTTLWAVITSSSVRDSDGQFLYAVRTQEDISARKAAEAALARRAEEQEALYEFTEALQYSGDQDDVCARAIQAILRALGCDRAAVLLLDAQGAMKFVDWRGLSDSYRAGVEGHSPWPASATNATPICIGDVADSDLPHDLKRTVRAEGIAALTFIPIMANGRLLGKFVTYYDAPHTFHLPEIGLAVTIAYQLGFALERITARCAAQHLAAIVESSHDAIVSKDLNGIISTWNQGAERLFGYTAAEAVGKSITILIPPDRLDEEPQILARIRRGERVDHFETVRRRQNGSLVDISLTISPVLNDQGRIIGASKIARDNTERKLAEARLQESERRLKDLLSAIPAAIYTTDARDRVTYFNDKAVELAGRTPVLGSDEWCVTWKLYRPDGTALPYDECPMAIALREGRAIRDAEAIAERPDGTRVPFIPYPTPLRDAKGNIAGAINMLVDISERKLAENQQRILFDELNHRVKNNMQSLQSLLSRATRKIGNAEAKSVLEEASRRIGAMTAAQQVLYGSANVARFDAQQFLDAVSNTARQTLPREVSIRCEANDVCLCNEVAMPLALIVNELLTNAVKHGSDASDRPTVRIQLRHENNSFVLCVEDEGPGFDFKAVRKRSSGLQLVEGLARQLRGKFEVSTKPKTRCTVEFS